MWTLRAFTLPSRFAPNLTVVIWSRPWCEVVMCSERVSVHLTGRCSLRASATISASSPYTCSLAPKPPPTSGAMTRILSSDMPSTPLSTKRVMWGTWVEEYSVTPSPWGSASEERGSIGAPLVRWLTMRRSMTTSESEIAWSASPPEMPQSCVRLVPKASWTSGEPSSSAFSGSTTAGRVS